MGRLSGKVALVTGASRGLGRAIALAYAREGADLAICARGGALLDRTAEELRAMGAGVLSVRADVADPADVERLVATALQEYGRIDILVNNAAILGPSPMPYLLDYPADDFAEVLRVNVMGPFLVSRLVLGAMLSQGSGVVINVTSEAGSVGYAGWGAYGISKFALEGMTETWADEVAETGVRVNMVDPGSLATEMHRLANPEPDYPLTDPADVTDVFVYLASDDARHENGRRFVGQEFSREV